MARKADEDVDVPVDEEEVEHVAEEDHASEVECGDDGSADSGAEVDDGDIEQQEDEDDNKDEQDGDDDGDEGDDDNKDEDGDDDDDDVPDLLASKKRKKKEDGEKKGVLYMSRVPPFMKPDHVRRLLSEYGTIGRIYLVEEDKTARKRRLKNGGNRQVNFTEGWIEFKRKKDAKRVAKALNTTPIGGKKRNKYHDDIWNLKYLKGFQWSHLTEKVAYENRVRDQKLRLEVAQAAKENAAFLERVDQAKKLEKMVERKHALHPETATVPETIRRTFRQNEAVDKAAHGSLDDSTAASVLGKVFKKRKLQ